MRPVLLLFAAQAQQRAGGPDLTRHVLVSVLAILAVVGCGLLVRRFAAGHLRRRAARRSLQVLDVLPLSSKQRLVVVRCYDRSFLLGVGDKEVRSIAELDATEPVELAPVDKGAATASVPSFRDVLSAGAPVPPEDAPRRPVLENGRGVLG